MNSEWPERMPVSSCRRFGANDRPYYTGSGPVCQNYETFVKQPFWLDANLFEILQTTTKEKKVKSI